MLPKKVASIHHERPDRTHTRQIPDMKGLANQMPVTATLFTLAALLRSHVPRGRFIIYIARYICAVYSQ